MFRGGVTTDEAPSTPHPLLTGVLAALLTGSTIAPAAAGYTWLSATWHVAQIEIAYEDASHQLAWLEVRTALSRSVEQLDAGNFGLAHDQLAVARELVGAMPAPPTPDLLARLDALQIDADADRGPQRDALTEAIRRWDAEHPGA